MDKPLPVEYLAYLWNLLHGDLGISQLPHQPVLTDLQHAIPATMELAFPSIAFAIVVGSARRGRGHPAEPGVAMPRASSLPGI